MLCTQYLDLQNYKARLPRSLAWFMHPYLLLPRGTKTRMFNTDSRSITIYSQTVDGYARRRKETG